MRGPTHVTIRIVGPGVGRLIRAVGGVHCLLPGSGNGNLGGGLYVVGIGDDLTIRATRLDELDDDADVAAVAEAALLVLRDAQPELVADATDLAVEVTDG